MRFRMHLYLKRRRKRFQFLNSSLELHLCRLNQRGKWLLPCNQKKQRSSQSLNLQEKIPSLQNKTISSMNKFNNPLMKEISISLLTHLNNQMSQLKHPRLLQLLISLMIFSEDLEILLHHNRSQWEEEDWEILEVSEGVEGSSTLLAALTSTCNKKKRK